MFVEILVYFQAKPKLITMKKPLILLLLTFCSFGFLRAQHTASIEIVLSQASFSFDFFEIRIYPDGGSPINHFNVPNESQGSFFFEENFSEPTTGTYEVIWNEDCNGAPQIQFGNFDTENYTDAAYFECKRAMDLIVEGQVNSDNMPVVGDSISVFIQFYDNQVEDLNLKTVTDNKETLYSRNYFKKKNLSTSSELTLKKISFNLGATIRKCS